MKLQTADIKKNTAIGITKTKICEGYEGSEASIEEVYQFGEHKNSNSQGKSNKEWVYYLRSPHNLHNLHTYHNHVERCPIELRPRLEGMEHL